MTENEAIKALKLEGGLEISGKATRTIEFFNGLVEAEKALEEIQAYRAIGTVKEIKIREAQFARLSEGYLNDLTLLREYQSIGTIDEFKALREKNEPKKPIYSDFDENEDGEIIPYKAACPICGHEFEFGTWNDEQNHHCDCGQNLDWQ